VCPSITQQTGSYGRQHHNHHPPPPPPPQPGNIWQFLLYTEVRKVDTYLSPQITGASMEWNHNCVRIVGLFVTIIIVILTTPHYSYRTELWRIEYPSRLGSRASSHKFEKSPDLDPDPSERNTVSFRVGVAGQPLRLLLLLLLWKEITMNFQFCIEKRISSSSSSSIIRICHTSTL